MRKATYSDRRNVVDILARTFEDNPGSTWLLRRNIDRFRGIRRMSRYVFLKAMNREGAYISSNGMGVALCYRYNAGGFFPGEVLAELWFALTSISVKRFGEVRYRESYRDRMRPSSGDYLYFWFLGVLPGGDRAAMELGKGILEEADRSGLPVYLETALPRMKKVYERYGFETYHYWEEPEKGIMFWFLRREPGAPLTPAHGKGR